MNRAEELVLLFADGLAPEAELRELEVLLAADETARRACLRLIEVEVMLRASGEANAVDGTMERLRALLAEQTAGRVMEQVRAAIREQPASSSRRPQRIALAAAALVFLGLAGVWLSWPEKTGVSLADIQGDVRVARGHRTFPVAGGLKLEAGDRLVTGTNGAAAVHFEAETTRIAVDAEADLTLVAVRPAKQLRLLAGQALAKVARQPDGHPLLFQTPHAAATVAGTEFWLVVKTAETRLDVQEGLVRLTLLGAAGGVEVRGGEYAVAAPGKIPVARAYPLEVLRAPSSDESPRNRADWLESTGTLPMPGPFAAESPWNRPLGDGAAFTPVRAKSFPPAAPLNNIVKRLPLNLATATDPLRGIVVNGQRMGESRVSDRALLPASGMLPALFLDGASLLAFELLRVTRQADGDLAAECGHRVDLQGSGFSVQGGGVSTFGVPPVTELDAALNRLLPLLQVVTNNTREPSGRNGTPPPSSPTLILHPPKP